MASKKRILIISAVFPPEQVTSAYLNFDLAKALSQEFDVTVLRPKPTRPLGSSFNECIWQDTDFETIQINSYTHPESNVLGRIKEAISFSKNVVKFLKSQRDRFDFVYNDGWQLFGLFIIARACVRFEIPYIVPIQDIYPESFFSNRYSSFVKYIARQLLIPFDKYYQKHAFRIRTISKEMADYLSKTRKIQLDKYIVVNNWQDDESFSKLPVREIGGRLRFEYVGSINIHANVSLIISAFAEAHIPNSELYIYGNGNQKENCEKLVVDLNLDNVVFNVVSREQVPTVQSMADVLVLALPSGNAKFCLPSKLTSYLLSERPVLASVDLDSSTSMIINGSKCGLVVSPDDKDELVNGFKFFSALSLKDLRMMGNNGRAFALKNLTKTVNLNIVIETIKKALQ